MFNGTEDRQNGPGFDIDRKSHCKSSGMASRLKASQPFSKSQTWEKTVVKPQKRKKRFQDLKYVSHECMSNKTANYA